MTFDDRSVVVFAEYTLGDRPVACFFRGGNISETESLSDDIVTEDGRPEDE